MLLFAFQALYIVSTVLNHDSMHADAFNVDDLYLSIWPDNEWDERR